MLHRRIFDEYVRFTRFTAALAVSTRNRNIAGSRLLDRFLFVQPSLRIVSLLFFIPPREDATQIFRVYVVFAKDEWRIRIVPYVFIKPLVLREDVSDQSAQKDNVTACT